MEKVVAITVTYNRTSTLVKCLQSLESQSRSVDKIIIVDNNSRQEEKEKLEKLVENKVNIDVIWLQNNLGGAGGFEAGMELAVRNYKADWYWLMDDDAYPRENCLEQLLKYSGEIPGAGCLAPLIYGLDLKQYQLYHHKRLSRLLLDDIPIADTYEALSDINLIEANAFVGPLFSRQAVESVGIADGSLFIYGDDTEYTFRVAQKFKLYLIRDAVIDHQDPPLVSNYLQPSAWWKEYYSNRNHFFRVKKFHVQRYKRILAYIGLIYPLLKLAGAAAVKPKYKGYRRLRIYLLFRSAKDGLLDKRGKTIAPERYSNYLKQIKK